MFTSRAEYRLLLRQDNADQRLTPLSYEIGLASKESLDKVEEKYRRVSCFSGFLKSYNLLPQQINSLLTAKTTRSITQKQKVSTILLRPQVFLHELITHVDEIRNFAEQNNLLKDDIIEETELMIKYESYIGKEQELVDKQANLENHLLSGEIEYNKIVSLSHEAREKLSKIRPHTIGQASRISGVSPADISVLIVYLGR